MLLYFWVNSDNSLPWYYGDIQWPNIRREGGNHRVTQYTPKKAKGRNFVGYLFTAHGVTFTGFDNWERLYKNTHIYTHWLPLRDPFVPRSREVMTLVSQYLVSVRYDLSFILYDTLYSCIVIFVPSLSKITTSSHYFLEWWCTWKDAVCMCYKSTKLKHKQHFYVRCPIFFARFWQTDTTIQEINTYFHLFPFLGRFWPSPVTQASWCIALQCI